MTDISIIATKVSIKEKIFKGDLVVRDVEISLDEVGVSAEDLLKLAKKYISGDNHVI